MSDYDAGVVFRIRKVETDEGYQYVADTLIRKRLYISHKFWNKEYEDSAIKFFKKKIEEDIRTSDFQFMNIGF